MQFNMLACLLWRPDDREVLVNGLIKLAETLGAMASTRCSGNYATSVTFATKRLAIGGGASAAEPTSIVSELPLSDSPDTDFPDMAPPTRDR